MIVHFKRLMRLDYASAFQCGKCAGRALVFDGVTFGPPKIFSQADATQANINASRIEVDSRYVLTILFFM